MNDRKFNKILVLGVILFFIGSSIISSTGGTSVERHSMQDNKTPFKGLKTRGNILYVGGDGPGNYSKIQDAINDASNGDTVFVFDDSSPYYENLIIDKSINLSGENSISTVIDGVGNLRTIDVTADWVNISGFTIEKSGNYWPTGIGIRSSYNTIKGNIISNSGSGIIVGDNYNIITDNTLIKNRDGICLTEDSAYNSVTENNIVSNSGGIYLKYSSNNNIRANNVISSGGIRIVYFSNNNTITSNIISNNRDGISIWYSCNYNTITDNLICRNNEWGIYFGDSCNILIADNIISWNKKGGIIFTNTSNINIMGNIITSNNLNGVYLSSVYTNNTLSGNIISNHRVGIYLLESVNNTISRNNLLDNKLNAFSDNSKNTWKRNYWNRPRFLPKLIFGIRRIETRFGIDIPLPQIDIDLRPALKPYDI